MCCSLLFALALPAAAQEEISGLVLPRDDGGMYLRNEDGQFEIEWTDETRVALEVNTRQFAQLAKKVVDLPATVEEEARQALSPVEREVMDKPEELFKRAGAVIESFLDAPNYKERLKFVRSPKVVAPLMERYYKDHPDGAVEFRKPRDGWKLAPYQNFLLGSVELADFSEISIAVERMEDGRFLVDWESFVGYCDVPWDQIKKKRSTEPFLIRARATGGDYFNFGYTDDKWACIQLQDSDQEHTIYAYTELDGPQLKALTKVMSISGTTHVTMKVAYPEGGKADNQVHVMGGISRGWVTMRESKPPGTTFQYQVHSSKQKIEFALPAGPVCAELPVRRVDEALERLKSESWIEERGLRLFFNQKRTQQLPSKEDPRFVGEWGATTKPRTLTVNGDRYELSLKNGGQANALLFNVLTTADCRPFVNRARVIGKKMGGVLVADEIHLTPIGDQAAMDDPKLPRYLFIGDSISGNYSNGLRAALKGKFNLHHPPTNCGPSAKGRSETVEWLGGHETEGRGWDVISFNFGHWDAGINKANYQANLEAVIAELNKTRAKLIWVTTCPVPSGNDPVGELGDDGKAPGRKAGVMEKYLNPWAAEVIAKHPEISVCDQWQFVKDDADGIYKEWWAGKDVHFRGEMADQLGALLGDHVEKVMAGK